CTGALQGSGKVAFGQDLVGGRVVSRGRSRERDSQAPRLCQIRFGELPTLTVPKGIILHFGWTVHTSINLDSYTFRIVALHDRRTSFRAKYPAPRIPITAARMVSTRALALKICGYRTRLRISTPATTR